MNGHFKGIMELRKGCNDEQEEKTQGEIKLALEKSQPRDQT